MGEIFITGHPPHITMESHTYYAGGQKITTFYKPVVVTEHVIPTNKLGLRMLARPDSWVNL
jgi:hypothetical protein